jgi:hypothetical protein
MTNEFDRQHGWRSTQQQLNLKHIKASKLQRLNHFEQIKSKSKASNPDIYGTLSKQHAQTRAHEMCCERMISNGS